MKDRDGLIRLFHRVAVRSILTKPFFAWDIEVRNIIYKLLERENIDRTEVICYFDGEDKWFLVSLDALFFIDGNTSVVKIKISNLHSARIDIRKNKNNGFVPGKGFGLVSFVTDHGEVDVNLEPGPGAEGILMVVNELIKENQRKN